MQQQSQWGSGHITTLSINDAHMGPQVTGNYQPLACVGRGTYAGLYGNTQNPTGRGSGEARVPNPHQACQVFPEARIFRSHVSLPGAMRGGGVDPPPDQALPHTPGPTAQSGRLSTSLRARYGPSRSWSAGWPSFQGWGFALF